MPQEPKAPVLRAGVTKEHGEKIMAINQTFKERDIRAFAKKKGIPYVDLVHFPIQQEALQMTTKDEIAKFQAVPFELISKELHVAAVDPESESLTPLLKPWQDKGFLIKRYMCSTESLEAAKKNFERIALREEVPVKTTVEEKKGMNIQDLFSAEEKKVFEAGSGPEMINLLNLAAVKFHASDVHAEPQEKLITLRMRRDGELYEVLTLQAKQYLLLSGEIKRTADLKINITDEPQDGSYSFVANQRSIQVRVSTIPSAHGESIALRILDAARAVVELDHLGFSDKHSEQIKKFLEKTKGLILVTGPTGSGKTSTLYSCLRLLNTPDRKIMTLEDPIEYRLERVVQSQINEKEDYDFPNGLRAILRQDPDIIMIGEIRDGVTAEIALQASLTGHLVFSTFHANDALASLPRLTHMGVKEHILASGLDVIIAQRLVRKICSACKAEVQLPAEYKVEMDAAIASLQKKGIAIPQELKIYVGKGCDVCAKTTFEGRTVIAEVLNVTDAIRDGILKGAPASELLGIAEKEGFFTMKEDAVLKVLAGVTTIDEAWRALR